MKKYDKYNLNVVSSEMNFQWQNRY